MYIKFEKCYGEFDCVWYIFEIFIVVYFEFWNWIKWVKFEEEYGMSDFVCEVFGIVVEILGDDYVDEKFFIVYVRFEVKFKEYECVCVIYKYVLDWFLCFRFMVLYKVYMIFEK